MKRAVLLAALALTATAALQAVEKSMTISFEKTAEYVKQAVKKEDFVDKFVSSGSENVGNISSTVSCYPDAGCLRLGTGTDRGGNFLMVLSKTGIKVPTRITVKAHPQGTYNKDKKRMSIQFYDASYSEVINLRNTTQFEDYEFSLNEAAKSSELKEFLLGSLSGVCLKSITIYYDEKEVSSISDIKAVGSYKVNQELAGVAELGGTLYARSQYISASQPSPGSYTGSYKGEIGKTAYEDNDLGRFVQYDWVAIDNTTPQTVEAGINLLAGFTARYDGTVLIPTGGIRPGDAASVIDPVRYRAENFMHGGFTNYAEDSYPAFYVKPRVNEVAEFMGFIETKGGVSYLYSDNVNGRLDGQGVKLFGEVDGGAVDGKYTKFRGVVATDTATSCGYKILLLDKLGKDQIITGVEPVEQSVCGMAMRQEGELVIVRSESTRVEAYDAAGRIIKAADTIDGEASLTLPKGYYIVKAGGETKAIVVR